VGLTGRSLARPPRGRLGRFLEPALWILVTLAGGPRTAVGLFDGVRRLDGPIGHGTLLGALARLEHLGLIDAGPADRGRPAYRLSGVGSAAAGAATDLMTRPTTEGGHA
jgi:DNA-binding PadR family transcriptional regulator